MQESRRLCLKEISSKLLLWLRLLKTERISLLRLEHARRLHLHLRLTEWDTCHLWLLREGVISSLLLEVVTRRAAKHHEMHVISQAKQRLPVRLGIEHLWLFLLDGGEEVNHGLVDGFRCR